MTSPLFSAPCPQLIERSRFHPVEIHALLAEGLLVPCGRHFRAAAVPECPELRAAALALDVPPSLGVRGRTAAWVWWGGDAPTWPPEVFVGPAGFNALPLQWRGAGIGRLPRSGPDDVLLLCGLRITSPLRTAADVAIRLGRATR